MAGLFSFRRRGARTRSPVRALVDLCHALLSERGEVSGARIAAQAIAAYRALTAPEREEFFGQLMTEFSPNPDALSRALDAYRSDPSLAHLQALQSAAEPPRQELFRRLNVAAGGTSALLELRRGLLESPGARADLGAIDADLLHLLRSWFNRGFLNLRRIDWETPAVILERLIEYEGVHEIQGWHDLRRRLAADRRCYAFFHPVLPHEPLIFIEIALTRGMPDDVQSLIDPDSPVGPPDRADHAVFYSITNCQPGLRGVSFGNFLIKQVAEDLAREFPRIRNFWTLSPLPGFRDWAIAENRRRGVVSDELLAALQDLTDPVRSQQHDYARVEPQAVAAAVTYLVHAKRDGRAPLDAVARFHLANGARLERVNWMGDLSPAGVRRAFGLTVNYAYRLEDVERNHEAYARDYRVIVSPSIGRVGRLASRHGSESAGETT
jgi:malonyl-CoA decarboxylase